MGREDKKYECEFHGPKTKYQNISTTTAHATGFSSTRGNNNEQDSRKKRLKFLGLNYCA